MREWHERPKTTALHLRGAGAGTVEGEADGTFVAPARELIHLKLPLDTGVRAGGVTIVRH
jgi:hypothetical protein